MQTPPSRSVALRIECSDLPPSDWGGHPQIWLGIQCGKEVVQQTKLPASNVSFEANLRLSTDSSQAKPNFLGPYSQGPAGERFVYLCWGRPHVGGWLGFRRAKLPLSGLTWPDVESDQLLVKVRCTDAKGAPICATLRPELFTWSI